MTILIADDLLDLVDLVEAFVEANMPGWEILKAYDGAQAIEYIKNSSSLDLVVSDFNMPLKNGADVFVELRRKYETTPFLLLSTVTLDERPEFKNAKFIDNLGKPFSFENLDTKIKNLLHSKSKEQVNSEAKKHFVSININLLYRVGLIHADVFLEMGNGSFIKVLHKDSYFSNDDLKRFQGKNIQNLHIEHGKFRECFNHCKDLLSLHEALESVDSNYVGETMVLVHSIINANISNFGWDRETIELTVSTIQGIINFVIQSQDLSSLANSLKKIQGSVLSKNTMQTCLFGVSILKQLDWYSRIALEKFVFAVILHDVELSEDLYITMVEVLANMGASAFSSPHSKEFKEILEHSDRIAENLQKWAQCPPDINIIIQQHHEKPDGTGFPNKLYAQQIAPIAAVLILAEDVVFNSYKPNALVPSEFLKSKKDYYFKGEFKHIYNAAMKVLNGF